MTRYTCVAFKEDTKYDMDQFVFNENQSPINPIKSTPKTLSSFPSLNLASLKQSSEEEKKEQIRRESSDF